MSRYASKEFVVKRLPDGGYVVLNRPLVIEGSFMEEVFAATSFAEVCDYLDNIIG